MQCDNCTYWLGGTQGDPGQGLCRRFPPRDGLHPETAAYDWCGEWGDNALDIRSFGDALREAVSPLLPPVVIDQ